MNAKQHQKSAEYQRNKAWYQHYFKLRYRARKLERLMQGWVMIEAKQTRKG